MDAAYEKVRALIQACSDMKDLPKLFAAVDTDGNGDIDPMEHVSELSPTLRVHGGNNNIFSKRPRGGSLNIRGILVLGGAPQTPYLCLADGISCAQADD